MSPFLNNPSLLGISFEMWAKIIKIDSPVGTMATFTSFMALFHLQQNAEESWSVYMSRVRRLENMLRKKSITDLIVFFAVFAADPTRYGEIAENFRRGDTKILGADLSTLEGLGDSIEERNLAETSFC